MCNPLKAVTDTSKALAYASHTNTPGGSSSGSTSTAGPGSTTYPDGTAQFYRGEKDITVKGKRLIDQRRANGFTPRHIKSTNGTQAIFDAILAEIKTEIEFARFNFGPKSFARKSEETIVKKGFESYTQSLRTESKDYAVATALKVDGAYESDHCYTIVIPGIRSFAMTETGLGARLSAEAPITGPYFFLNADTVAAATIFGVGHKSATFEATFFTNIPVDMILGVGPDYSPDQRQSL